MALTNASGSLPSLLMHGDETMANEAKIERPPRGSRWRVAGWGTAVLLLLLPFVAMQFTSEVNWTLGDFIFAGLMFGAVGLAVELTVRATANGSYRAAVGFALAAAFLTIWVNGAVGMIGSEENGFNLLFLGVVMIALVGAVFARFQAHGMMIAMGIAALAQLAVSAVGMFSDLRGGIFSALFAGLWLLSAACFRNAADERD